MLFYQTASLYSNSVKDENFLIIYDKQTMDEHLLFPLIQVKSFQFQFQSTLFPNKIIAYSQTSCAFLFFHLSNQREIVLTF